MTAGRDLDTHDVKAILPLLSTLLFDFDNTLYRMCLQDVVGIREFRENRSSGNHNPLSSVNNRKFISYCPHLFSVLDEIWYKRFERNVIQHLLVSRQ